VENELPSIIPEDHARGGAGGKEPEVHPPQPSQRQNGEVGVEHAQQHRRASAIRTNDPVILIRKTLVMYAL
jgi:hypothetical protein